MAENLSNMKSVRRLRLALGVAAVLVAGTVLFLIWRRSGSEESRSEPAAGAQGAADMQSAAVTEEATSAPSSSAERPVGGSGQAALPADPVSPWGTRILDVSKYPDLAGQEVRRVTVDFDNLVLADATQAFASQAGVSVVRIAETSRANIIVPADHQVSMHLHNAPLLQGLLELVNEGAEISESDAKMVRLRPNRTSALETGKICIAGPYATVLQNAAKGVPVVLGGAMLKENEAKMAMSIYAEPTIRLLQVRQLPVFEELVDDKGQVGTPTTHSDTALVDPLKTCAGMDVILAFPGVPGTKIASVRGKIQVTQQVRAEAVSSGSLAAGPVTQKAGEISMLFEGFKKTLVLRSTLAIQQYDLSIVYSRGGVDPATWKKLVEIWPTIDPVIQSADGKSMPAHADTNRRPKDAADSVRVFYQLSGGAGNLVPDRVKLMVPVEVLEVVVPFEFKDVVIQQH